MINIFVEYETRMQSLYDFTFYNDDDWLIGARE